MLYFFVIGRRIILTNGFVKKTDKTPESVKALAKKYRAEWEALDPEFAIIEALNAARRNSGLTQQQLAERTGINQADISKLERGSANPSLRTLHRIAAGMGMQLKLEFIPLHHS